MSWEQEITQELDEMKNAALRFDVEQNLTNTEKTTAKSNIGFGTSVALIEDNNYKITFS